MHYQMLIRLVNAEMGQMVNAIPSPSQNQHCDDMIPPFPITLDESTPIDGRKYQNAHQPPTFSFDPKVPSNYLRSKCPCCFRSSFTLRSQLSAHCIISFDVNFQLKCIKDYDQCKWDNRGRAAPKSQLRMYKARPGQMGT